MAKRQQETDNKTFTAGTSSTLPGTANQPERLHPGESSANSSSVDNRDIQSVGGGAENGGLSCSDAQSLIKRYATGGDSSVNLVDSISAFSGRQNWSGEDMAEDDEHSIGSIIEGEQVLVVDEIPQESAYQIEPIIIRGNGNLTLFGLSNSFMEEFPSALIGRVSKEEFDRTMRRINTLLRDQQSLSAKLLVFGSIFCCCFLGLTLVWPSIALKRRNKMNLEKILASENNRLYSKLGLNWKLAEQRCYSNHAFVEYVLMIEFTPKINLYLPD